MTHYAIASLSSALAVVFAFAIGIIAVLLAGTAAFLYVRVKMLGHSEAVDALMILVILSMMLFFSSYFILSWR